MAARRSSALAASFALLLAACVGSGAPSEDARGDDAITVASFDFPESVLLAEIYSRAIEGAGFRVEREAALGPRELVMPALLEGLVDFVPEYSGSGLQFLAGDGSTSPDHEINHERFTERLRALDVTALDASPAEDQNGFAVTPETAQRYGLRTLTDLARVSHQMVFGGPPECLQRPFCLPGLEQTYGIEFGDVISNLDAGGPRTRRARPLRDNSGRDRERGLGAAVHRRAPNAERGGRARCDPRANRVALARIERSRSRAAVESPNGMDATTEGIEQGRSKGPAHPEQRRRPSGEPPALPHELGRSGKFFLLLVLYFVAAITAFLVFPSLKSVFERWDHTRQLWITDLSGSCAGACSSG